MNITVKLFGILQEKRFNKLQTKYTEKTTILQVMDEIGIPQHVIGVIFVNGRYAFPDRELKEDDVLAFFPLLGGG